ncbi:MAG: transcriptional regulator NrdR [Elusimicrobia bacterium]|nr:transcriptional regulator NrdR [Elusimicrobiota bacterium]MBU2615085.1 transcriptional regulator NrdR [Elusimicrobiota bacterium]
MKCPYCTHFDTKITNSRPLDESSVVRRRRECPECAKRFTTYERIEEMPLMVSKTDNQREPFDRNKLRDGITLACRKRPIDQNTVEKAVADIERELQEYVLEVPSRIIGEKVLKKLLELDPIAYIRFASVYYQYADIETFLNELKRIKEIKDK